MEFNQQPFPKLITGGSEKLEGTDLFPAWRNFEVNGESSDGNLPITVMLESANDAVPSAAQVKAYRYLKENELQVMAKLLAGLCNDYPQIREAYGIDPEYLPEISHAGDLNRLIRPLNIYINREAKDDYAYTGFECDCLWDPEHGLGIMMHLDDYIGCNDAEAAWNLDLAQS